MVISKRFNAGLLVLGLSLSFSGIALANEAQHKEAIKLMNESAAALQSSRPELASELTKWSNDQANEKEIKGEKKELKEKAKKEMHENREAHIKLLRDSAAALQQSNLKLAADLNKMADKKEKWAAEKKEDRKGAEEKADEKEAQGK